MINIVSASFGKTTMRMMLKLQTTINEVIGMEILSNIHPGEILSEEFLKPFKITAYRLAKDTMIPATRVSEILKGRRRITADTALRLSKFFGNSPDFWLGIQMEYDLRKERQAIQEDLEKIPAYCP
jgi:addiction module HigA family antidote